MGAIQMGHLRTLKWLRDEGCPLCYDAVPHAAFFGRTGILEWLRSEGYEFCERTLNSAALGGELETVKWLRSLDPPIPWDETTCLSAFDGGQLDVLKWMKCAACPWPDDRKIVQAARSAAQQGRIEILEWLRSEGIVFDERTCKAASAGGKLETLKWLRNLDPPCPWYQRDCRSAAEVGGHTNVVDWIEDQIFAAVCHRARQIGE